ncbi:MAG: hypothetical protein GXY03_12410 [Solirubrobacterales bacterium]|nr:hypothetical protein [Solirubrobacterales bacterium]
MSGRTLALSGALALVAILGALTLRVMFVYGIDVLVVISLAIVAFVGFGVIGALRHPPEG